MAARAYAYRTQWNWPVKKKTRMVTGWHGVATWSSGTGGSLISSRWLTIGSAGTLRRRISIAYGQRLGRLFLLTSCQPLQLLPEQDEWQNNPYIRWLAEQLATTSTSDTIRSTKKVKPSWISLQQDMMLASLAGHIFVRLNATTCLSLQQEHS